jgi:hypothetical protein
MKNSQSGPCLPKNGNTRGGNDKMFLLLAINGVFQIKINGVVVKSEKETFVLL